MSDRFQPRAHREGLVGDRRNEQIVMSPLEERSGSVGPPPLPVEARTAARSADARASPEPDDRSTSQARAQLMVTSPLNVWSSPS